MKVVIIEDEQHTAKDLELCIKKTEPSAEIVATLSSVKEAADFFRESPEMDLIFSDIQLGDGRIFSIFDSLKNTVPVIFCTAYDEYALHAFKAAGIDYILKPFTVKTIAASLARYKDLQQKLSRSSLSYENIGELFNNVKATEQRSVLVYHKEKITPVRIGNIAIFYLQHELTHLITLDKQHYFINHTLEELEKLTAGQFYRANRQFLVNRSAIQDVSQYFGRKLLINLTIPFSEKITVGKVKTSPFLAWLANS